MVIKNYSSHTDFSKIGVGDCVLFIDTYYMKILEVKLVTDFENKPYNAVCLHDGTLAHFDDNEMIIPVELTATAKGV